MNFSSQSRFKFQHQKLLVALTSIVINALVLSPLVYNEDNAHLCIILLHIGPMSYFCHRFVDIIFLICVTINKKKLIRTPMVCYLSIHFINDKCAPWTGHQPIRGHTHTINSHTWRQFSVQSS